MNPFKWSLEIMPDPDRARGLRAIDVGELSFGSGVQSSLRLAAPSEPLLLPTSTASDAHPESFPTNLYIQRISYYECELCLDKLIIVCLSV